MKKQTIISLAILGLTSAAFADPTAWVINGRKVWRSTNGGASFSHTGTVTNNIGTIGLGYHAGTDTYYTTATGGGLYSIDNLNSAAPTLTLVRNIGGSTISFDFFDNTFRGARGNQLIEFDITNNASAITVSNTGTGTGGTPSTAKIGSDYFGMNGSGSVFKFTVPGNGSTQIGINNVTGLGPMDVAGGSGLNGVYYTSAGYKGTDIFKFGTINTTTGIFTLISQTNVGVLTSDMGMTVADDPNVIIPLPTGAAMAVVGMGFFGVRRRRS